MLRAFVEGCAFKIGHRAGRWFVLALTCLPMAAAWAYDADIHQQFTFLAAKQFNQCAADAGLLPLTPLQVRYIARTNVRQVEGRWFRNWLRWNYYDRAGQSEKGALWLFDTRMHKHFNEVVEQLEDARSLADRYSNLGRLTAYLQDATSPAHVVPVYYSRWWRFSMSDRFDGYPMDVDAVEAVLNADCRERLGQQAEPPANVLVDTASNTLRAVQAPILGMPTSWQAFWKLAEDPGSFGEYGPAGNNFGRHTEFRCAGQRCVLLDEDPLYHAFAVARHAEAVRATVRAMAWLQAQDPVTLQVGSR